VTGVNPGLDFDLLTVQRSNLDSAERPKVGFTNFELTSYQSDLNANSNDSAQLTIATILVDQTFGFDPDVALGCVL
jgi:hypothetical protein